MAPFRMKTIRELQAQLAFEIATLFVERELETADKAYQRFLAVDDHERLDDLGAASLALLRDDIVATAQRSVFAALVGYTHWCAEMILERAQREKEQAFANQALPIPTNRDVEEIDQRYPIGHPQILTDMLQHLETRNVSLPLLGEVRSGRLQPNQALLESWKNYRVNHKVVSVTDNETRLAQLKRASGTRPIPPPHTSPSSPPQSSSRQSHPETRGD